jgi:RHS repeat-associated protein
VYLAPNDDWYLLWDNAGSLTVSTCAESPVCTVTATATVPTSATAGAPVALTATGTPSGCGAGAPTYTWDFGDGTSAGTTASLTHVYAAAGTYTWAVTVQAGSATAVRTGTITVSPGAACTPTAAVVAAQTPLSLAAMWQGTGVTVAAGQVVTVTVAAGQTWTKGGEAWTAAGNAADPTSPANSPLPGGPRMALVGRTGTTGASFLVGPSAQVAATASGELFLAPNDEWYLVWGNAGSLTVSICVGASGGASAPAAWNPGRPILPSPALVIVASGLLALLAFAMGIRRRRRVVGAAVVLCLLVPATTLAQTTTQVIEYYTTDAIGSVRAVTKQVNGVWQVVARHDFMPASARQPSTASYGGPRHSATCFGRREGGPFGEEIAPPSPPQDKRLFTGKERDNETGMDYFGARYYRTEIGRFTGADPLGASARSTMPQSFNRYTYALNNPLRYVDPSGMDVSKKCVEDAASTIVVTVNVIYDKKRRPSESQLGQIRSQFLQKAQADFKHSNIDIVLTTTAGTWQLKNPFTAAIEGARSDALNVVFSGDTQGPCGGTGAGCSGHLGDVFTSIINMNNPSLSFDNRGIYTNTFEHELGHHFLGDTGGPWTVWGVFFGDSFVDTRLRNQEAGKLQMDFRRGIQNRAWAIDANPNSRIPQKR